MSAWQIKALVCLLILGGIFWGGDRFGAGRVQARWEIDKTAQREALLKAQGDVIQAQADQAAAISKAEGNYAKAMSDSAARVDGLLGSVRRLEAAVRKSSMPGAVANTAQPVTASGGSSSDRELAAAAGRLYDSIGAASGACLRDSARLDSILGMAPK